MNKKNYLILFLCIIFTELTGFLSSAFSGNVRPMYESLNKIPLSPPASLFGIVWPILYALIGVSLYLVIMSNAKQTYKINAYFLFGAQLLLNFLWSIVFFAGDKMGLAILVIILLDLFVIYQVIYYKRKISTFSSLILLPYLLWILFATYLNIGFYFTN